MVLIKQVFTLLPSGRDLLSACVRSYSSLMVFCDEHLLDTQSVSYPEEFIGSPAFCVFKCISEWLPEKAFSRNTWQWTFSQPRFTSNVTIMTYISKVLSIPTLNRAPYKLSVITCLISALQPSVVQNIKEREELQGQWTAGKCSRNESLCSGPHAYVTPHSPFFRIRGDTSAVRLGEWFSYQEVLKLR